MITSRVEHDEYTFEVTARDALSRPVQIEIATSLPGGDGQSEATESLSWYVDTPETDDEKGRLHRIRLTRQLEMRSR